MTERDEPSDTINRDRDIAYRGHLFEGHDLTLDAFRVSDAFLMEIALAHVDSCDPCNAYSLSVGIEEGT